MWFFRDKFFKVKKNTNKSRIKYLYNRLMFIYIRFIKVDKLVFKIRFYEVLTKFLC